MKLVPYLEALRKTDKENAAELAGAQATETRKALELHIAQVEQKICKADLAVQQMAQVYPLDIVGITSAMDDRNLLDLDRKNAVELMGQLFPA